MSPPPTSLNDPVSGNHITTPLTRGFYNPKNLTRDNSLTIETINLMISSHHHYAKYINDDIKSSGFIFINSYYQCLEHANPDSVVLENRSLINSLTTVKAPALPGYGPECHASKCLEVLNMAIFQNTDRQRYACRHACMCACNCISIYACNILV